ncbi:hypothetical protein BGX38DRAFT_418525 [Terfezia claveryi]|nr:hypothetical protein BGX38DRAFT_418525 [Terfezia claveryi]
MTVLVSLIFQRSLGLKDPDRSASGMANERSSCCEKALQIIIPKTQPSATDTGAQEPILQIAEYNLINQRVLQQQLTMEGYNTLVAQEGFNLIMSSTFEKAAPDDAQDISPLIYIIPCVCVASPSGCVKCS